MGIDDLLERSEIIFRYCQLKQSFSVTSHFLPPLSWSLKKKTELDIFSLNGKK